MVETLTAAAASATVLATAVAAAIVLEAFPSVVQR
jgi:hypothetical protein